MDDLNLLVTGCLLQHPEWRGLVPAGAMTDEQCRAIYKHLDGDPVTTSERSGVSLHFCLTLWREVVANKSLFLSWVERLEAEMATKRFAAAMRLAAEEVADGADPAEVMRRLEAFR